MRLYLGLLCGALLLVAASGCGTARAIVDDRDPDAVVESIRPTSGMSGEAVTFEAVCCFKPSIPESQKPRFEWNFGGAADPNVSYETNPAVNLRAGSGTAYNASLKLSGGCLGESFSATTPFQINIAPLTVATVTGNNGISKGSGSFSAVIATGEVEKYSWDFGGACSPSGSASENPTVSFATVTATTTYQGRLVVSNKYESSEFLFDITVTP